MSRLNYEDMPRWRFPFVIPFHPSEGFEEMRWNKKASLSAANWIIVAFFFTTIISQQYTSFTFNRFGNDQLNIYAIMLVTFIVALLFVLSNMGASTFLDGEGGFKEVWVTTAYALVPIVILTLVQVVLSFVLSIEEAFFFNLCSVLGWAWTGILLFTGIKVAHQFTFWKTIFSLVFTLVGIMVIVLMVFLSMSLVQQFFDFIATIIKEIRLR